MANTPFDEEAFHDYVVAHGYGEPTPEGYKLGRQLTDLGDDYALAAVEVVARGLTQDKED